MDEHIDPFESSSEFPDWLLEQISEHTPEGFILFAVTENGDVQCFRHATASIVEAGLRTKSLKILNSLNELEDEEITAQMFVQSQEDDEEIDTYEEDED